MSVISPRRGMLRPISDLPASVSPVLVEVEDADGTARQIAYGGGSGGGPIATFVVADAVNAVTANLSAKTITNPGTPSRWTAWEYQGATSAWQTDSFNAYRKIPAGTTLNMARTNGDVTTANCIGRLSLYRTTDVAGQSVTLGMGVPDTAIVSWNNLGYIFMNVARQDASNVTLTIQHRTLLNTSVNLGNSATVPHAQNSARYYYLWIAGGLLRAYSNTVDDFSTATLRCVASLPTEFIGPTSAFFPAGRRDQRDGNYGGLNGAGLYPFAVSFTGLAA